MGASFWHCVTAWKGDLDSSLKAMQLSKFHDDRPFLRDELERRGKALPETMDELREGEEYRDFMENVGAHSIVDLSGIGPHGDIFPLEVHDNLVLFGTELPTRRDWENAVEGRLGWAAHELVPQPWTGRCVVLFKDGRPDEVAFWGISGD